MQHIFVSYAHEDSDKVNPIVSQLKRHFRVWIDAAGIKQGDDWYATIQRNLRQSVAVLVFISNQSKDRPWVLYEIEEGQKHNIPCHPYLLENIPTIPTLIKNTQYIDGSQADAFAKLMEELPQTARLQGHQVISSDLIGTSTKFSEVAATLPSDCYLSSKVFDGVNFDVPLIGLPLRLTRYSKIYLIGRADDTLEPAPKVQLCVLMSGRDYKNYRVVVDVANYVLTRPDARLRLMLVEGPPNGDPTMNAGGYGLNVENPDEWRDAFFAMKSALSIYSRALPQIFFNGPGVLLYPLGADRRDIAPFELFQLNYGTARYERVLWRELLF